MRTIVLLMRRKSVAQGLMHMLSNMNNTNAIFEPEYDRAEEVIRSNGVSVALVEAAETGWHSISLCLRLCGLLREVTPGCKLILMCPETDKAVVALSVKAKHDGRIDDFVFYDSTMSYLASKLTSI